MNDSATETITQTLDAHERLLAKLRQTGVETITAAVEMITKALSSGGTVFICGNGGSAADAQHVAGELVGRFTRERKALAAVALSTDTSILTSIANDYAYEKVFARQVEALVREGDILWAFSTGGTSTNIIAAAESAKELGASVLAFTGKAQTQLERLCDVCICADSESTARSQEIHQLAYHIICDLVEMSFAGS